MITAVAAVILPAAYSTAQEYPPFGPHVPIAHFDHRQRPHLIPPPPRLKCPVLSPSCDDVRTAQSEWNTELLGYDSLDGRSTYQPLVVRQGERYIAYMAHHAGCAINRLNGQDEINGTSIIDVTDPRRPVYLHHITGYPASCTGSLDAAGNQMVRVCSGDSLPSNSLAEAQRKRGRYYMLRSNGNSSGQPGTESHQIFDVTDPRNPTLLTTLAPGETNTHKNWWECYTGIAFLVANDGLASANRADSAQGWQQSGSNQHIKIYNLHDPANPEYIRDFGFAGQQPGGTTVEGLVSPPTGIHGPISAGDRLYGPYGVGTNGSVAIYDRSKVLNGCNAKGASANCAKSPTQNEMLAPQLGWFTLPTTSLNGGHTSFPIFGEEDGKTRNLLLITSEETGNECPQGTAPHAAWLYDVTDEAHPKLIAEDPNDPARTKMDVPDGFDYKWIGIVPGNGVADNHCGTTNCSQAGVFGPSVTPQDQPLNANPNSFCNQGTRFGIHSSTELFYPPYYGKLAIFAWFTGGLRVFDIRNPDDPRPVAYFIPEPNDTGCGPKGGPSPGPGCTFANTGRDGHTVNAIHTNNVELDDRGCTSSSCGARPLKLRRRAGRATVTSMMMTGAHDRTLVLDCQNTPPVRDPCRGGGPGCRTVTARGNDREILQMKARMPLIVFSVFGLTAFTVAQDTDVASLVTWLCSSAAAQDPQTAQALRIPVGRATHDEVRSLLGKPWRVTNDADCEATQYSEVWEYPGENADGTFFRIHVAFSKDGKASLIARVPRRGKPLVLAYAADREHPH
jgi:hypothetical protein